MLNDIEDQFDLNDEYEQAEADYLNEDIDDKLLKQINAHDCSELIDEGSMLYLMERSHAKKKKAQENI
jgi:hypothetical protein